MLKFSKEVFIFCLFLKHTWRNRTSKGEDKGDRTTTSSTVKRKGRVIKNPPADAGDAGDAGLIPGPKIPGRRKLQPTQVFLPGETHKQKTGGLPSMGLQRIGHDSALKMCAHINGRVISWSINSHVLSNAKIWSSQQGTSSLFLSIRSFFTLEPWEMCEEPEQ